MGGGVSTRRLRVSWIVPLHDQIRPLNAVDLVSYKPLPIYSPREVTHYGEDD